MRARVAKAVTLLERARVRQAQAEAEAEAVAVGVPITTLVAAAVALVCTDKDQMEPVDLAPLGQMAEETVRADQTVLPTTQKLVVRAVHMVEAVVEHLVAESPRVVPVLLAQSALFGAPAAHAALRLSPLQT